MLKFTIFLFILSHFIFYTDYSPTANISNNQTQTSPTPEQITKIKLSKNSLKIPCSPGTLPSEGEICNENMTIDVSAFSDNTNDSLTYKYEVTGGQIVGQGKNVFWNLVNVSPGTYQIFAQLIDNQNRILETSETKILTVESCDCCGGGCVCSNFEIYSPNIETTVSTVKRGEKIVFIISGELRTVFYAEDSPYKWTVSGGEIIYEGDKNSLIRVRVNPDKEAKELKVTLKISDALSCFGDCIKEFSKTYKIIDEPNN